MSDSPAIFRRPPYGANPVVGERARRTYERILQSAMGAFELYGFDEANIDDIARGAETSRATVYQYFDSKQAILAALSQALGDEIMAAVDRMAPITPDAAGLAGFKRWARELNALSMDFAPVIDVWTGMPNQLPVVDSNDAFMQRFVKHLHPKMAAATTWNADPMGVAVTIFAVLQGVSDTLRDAGHGAERVGAILDDASEILHQGVFG